MNDDAIDWDTWASRSPRRRPACLRTDGKGKALSMPQAFAAIVDACAPFRSGIRFRAVPDVRLMIGDAVTRAPGDLLPAQEDGDVDAYMHRVEARLGQQPFHLRIEEPLFTDYALWASVRDALAEPRARIGTPVLPIASEFDVFGRGAAPGGAICRRRHDTWLQVVHGTLSVHCWTRQPDEEVPRAPRHVLHAAPGDLLYLPARLWWQPHARVCGLVLRLSWPRDGAQAVVAVKDMVAGLIDARLGEDERVPYLTYPAPAHARSGDVAPIPMLSECGRAFSEAVVGDDLRRLLQAAWARRVSACALEPVPAPLRATPLRHEDRLRPCPGSRPVRMRMDASTWLWAVNGHAFLVPADTHADRIAGWWRSPDTRSVAALCRDVRRGRERTQLHALLQKLHELRALTLEGAPAPAGKSLRAGDA